MCTPHRKKLSFRLFRSAHIPAGGARKIQRQLDGKKIKPSFLNLKLDYIDKKKKRIHVQLFTY